MLEDKEKDYEKRFTELEEKVGKIYKKLNEGKGDDIDKRITKLDKKLDDITKLLNTDIDDKLKELHSILNVLKSNTKTSMDSITKGIYETKKEIIVEVDKANDGISKMSTKLSKKIENIETEIDKIEHRADIDSSFLSTLGQNITLNGKKVDGVQKGITNIDYRVDKLRDELSLINNTLKRLKK